MLAPTRTLRRVGVVVALGIVVATAVPGSTVADASGASGPTSTTVAGTVPTTPPACTSPIDSIPGVANSDELITVVAPRFRSTHAKLQLYRRRGACLHSIAGPYAAFVGRRGLSAHHHEGDLTTPTGLFAFEPRFYGVAVDPGVRYRYHRLVCGDWWDEDSRSASYNRFVHVTCGATPRFASHSEALWLDAPAYDYLAVIAYNSSPAVPGRGSGIFLHASTGQPTSGCVTVPLVDLIRVLRDLRPSLDPLIDIDVTRSTP
ncbi:MAG: L,D-transpeptidase family protein [Acidimicrobiales bacterium]